MREINTQKKGTWNIFCAVFWWVSKICLIGSSQQDPLTLQLSFGPLWIPTVESLCRPCAQRHLSPPSFCWLEWFSRISNSLPWQNLNSVCSPRAAGWSHLNTQSLCARLSFSPLFYRSSTKSDLAGISTEDKFDVTTLTWWCSWLWVTLVSKTFFLTASVGLLKSKCVGVPLKYCGFL